MLVLNARNEGFTVPSFVDPASPQFSAGGIELWEIGVVLLVFVGLTLVGRLLIRLLFK